MNEAEPPPHELCSLFEAERVAPAVDVSARAAVRARLAASVAHVPLGQAAAGSLFAGASKALFVVAITIAAGAGTIAVIKHVRHDTPHAAAHSPSLAVLGGAEAPSAPTVSPATTVEKPALENVSVDPQRPVSPPRSQRSRVVASEKPASQNVVLPTPTQAELLRQAWAALRAGDGGRALALAKEDEQLHREGALVEEREALEICAFATLDRLEEARAAAERFFQQHPNSVHRALIRRAIEGKVSQ